MNLSADAQKKIPAKIYGSISSLANKITELKNANTRFSQLIKMDKTGAFAASLSIDTGYYTFNKATIYLEPGAKGKNIDFISISIDRASDTEKWKKFISSNVLQGIQLIADQEWKSDFIKKFGINSIPRFILIDPQGNIVNNNAERPSNPQLIKTLDQLMN